MTTLDDDAVKRLRKRWDDSLSDDCQYIFLESAPMTLVKELNRLAALGDVEEPVGPYVRAKCKEAADEIERLQTEIEQCGPIIRAMAQLGFQLHKNARLENVQSSSGLVDLIHYLGKRGDLSPNQARQMLNVLSDKQRIEHRNMGPGYTHIDSADCDCLTSDKK